jgi:hypothetical protein
VDGKGGKVDDTVEKDRRRRKERRRKEMEKKKTINMRTPRRRGV